MRHRRACVHDPRLAGDGAVLVAIVRAGALRALDGEDRAVRRQDVVLVDLQQELDLELGGDLDVKLEVVEVLVGSGGGVFPAGVLPVQAHRFEVDAVRIQPLVGEQGKVLGGGERLGLAHFEGLPEPGLPIELEEDLVVFRQTRVQVFAVGQNKESERDRSVRDVVDRDGLAAVFAKADDPAGDRIAVRVGKIESERVVEIRVGHDVGEVDLQPQGPFRDLEEQIHRIGRQSLGLLVPGLIEALLDLDQNLFGLVRDHDLGNVVLDIDLERAIGGVAVRIGNDEREIERLKLLVVQGLGIAVDTVLARIGMVYVVEQRELVLAARHARVDHDLEDQAIAGDLELGIRLVEGAVAVIVHEADQRLSVDQLIDDRLAVGRQALRWRHAGTELDRARAVGAEIDTQIACAHDRVGPRAVAVIAFLEIVFLDDDRLGRADDRDAVHFLDKRLFRRLVEILIREERKGQLREVEDRAEGEPVPDVARVDHEVAAAALGLAGRCRAGGGHAFLRPLDGLSQVRRRNLQRADHQVRRVRSAPHYEDHGAVGLNEIEVAVLDQHLVDGRAGRQVDGAAGCRREGLRDVGEVDLRGCGLAVRLLVLGGLGNLNRRALGNVSRNGLRRVDLEIGGILACETVAPTVSPIHITSPYEQLRPIAPIATISSRTLIKATLTMRARPVSGEFIVS